MMPVDSQLLRCRRTFKVTECDIDEPTTKYSPCAKKSVSAHANKEACFDDRIWSRGESIQGPSCP